MDLITPALGLIVWTSVIFIILLIVLRVVAWKPILKAIDKREQSIVNALADAERAEEETERLKADSERIIKEARAERNALLKTAEQLKAKILSEARDTAKKEGDRIVAQARAKIQNEKLAALSELKHQVAGLSIEIAEKILQTELKDPEKQRELASRLIGEANIN